MTDTIRDIFNRIPALQELRGAVRIEAELVLQNAIDDAAEDGRVGALTEPQPDGRSG